MISSKYLELKPISSFAPENSIVNSSIAFPISLLFTFRINELLLISNLTALVFSIDIVDTLSTASLKSLVKTSNLLLENYIMFNLNLATLKIFL